jgi:5-methylcytosine-specific restriction endonuclease McrA
MKYKCQKCSAEIEAKESYKGPPLKHCKECKRIDKNNSAKERRRGIKRTESKCENCGATFNKVGAPAKKYCDMCADSVKKEVARKHIDKYREKIGVKVGVGRGNNQGKKEESHAYKCGVRFYRDIVKERGDTNCNRCGIEIDFSQHYLWAVHHIDHDRTNNKSENLELLCKKCHQREHDCFGHKKKNHNVLY